MYNNTEKIHGQTLATGYKKIVNCANSLMPITTRTVAKGIPPRPTKPKGKPRTHNTTAKVNVKEAGNRKRSSRNDDTARMMTSLMIRQSGPRQKRMGNDVALRQR